MAQLFRRSMPAWWRKNCFLVLAYCWIAGLLAPIVNTGVFAIGMLTVFKPILQDYAGGTNAVYFLFVAFIGVNFLVEFSVNAVLSAAIARIVQVVQKHLQK